MEQKTASILGELFYVTDAPSCLICHTTLPPIFRVLQTALGTQLAYCASHTPAELYAAWKRWELERLESKKAA